MICEVHSNPFTFRDFKTSLQELCTAHTHGAKRLLQILQFIVKQHFCGYRNPVPEPRVFLSRPVAAAADSHREAARLHWGAAACGEAAWRDLSLLRGTFPSAFGTSRTPTPSARLWAHWCGPVSQREGAAALTKDGGRGRPGSSVALKPFPPAPPVTWSPGLRPPLPGPGGAVRAGGERRRGKVKPSWADPSLAEPSRAGPRCRPQRWRRAVWRWARCAVRLAARRWSPRRERIAPHCWRSPSPTRVRRAAAAPVWRRRVAMEARAASAAVGPGSRCHRATAGVTGDSGDGRQRWRKKQWGKSGVRPGGCAARPRR